MMPIEEKLDILVKSIELDNAGKHEEAERLHKPSPKTIDDVISRANNFTPIPIKHTHHNGFLYNSTIFFAHIKN